jgi:hypothetical protein
VLYQKKYVRPRGDPLTLAPTGDPPPLKRITAILADLQAELQEAGWVRRESGVVSAKSGPRRRTVVR